MKKINLLIITLFFFITASFFSKSIIAAAPLTLDQVAVNNNQVEIKNGEVNVTLNDYVKIAGITAPNQEVTVSFATEKYKALSDSHGNWLVLFSILNLADNKYSVEAKLAASENPYPLFTLVVGKGGYIPVKSGPAKLQNTSPSPLFYIFPSLLLGWILGSFYTKTKK